MAFCLGCGDDVSNTKGKRLLFTTASQHIVSLVELYVDEELAQQGREESFDLLVTTHNGKLCRKCFSSFERYIRVYIIIVISDFTI